MRTDPEKRHYRIINQALIDRMQAAFDAKTARNRQSGRTALYEGSFNPFTGYITEKSKDVFNFIVEFDNNSVQIINERVIDPLQRLAQVHDLPMIFAGLGDTPLHSVVQAGIPTGLSPDQVQAVQNWLLLPESGMGRAAEEVTGLTLPYDSLVVAPNCYINAGKFTPEQGVIFVARQVAVRAMRLSLRQFQDQTLPEDASFAPPYSYDDISYSSVCRLVDNRVPPNQLIHFADDAQKQIGENLQKRPLSVRIDRVYMGSALQRTPHLLH